MVFVEESYSAGVKTPLFRGLTTNFTASFNDIFRIIPVDLLNYEILTQNRNSTIAAFDIRNNDNITNVSWKMDTGQVVIVPNMSAVLNKSQMVFVYVETNYTTTGVYPTTGTANSSRDSDNSSGVAVV